jgi:threonine dehydrogenase-like Zn-dependent dehydrogenase
VGLSFPPPLPHPSLRRRQLGAIHSVQERLDQAERHGAIPINLNAKGAESALEILQARTEGRGADAVLEVVGWAKGLPALFSAWLGKVTDDGGPNSHSLKPAYDLAISLVRPFGFISSVGVHNSPSLLSGPDTYDKNLRGSWGRCPVRSTFPEALEVLRRNKELFLADSASGREGFVSHWMRLSEAPEVRTLRNP